MVTLTVRSPGGVVKDYNIERRTIKVASIKGYSHWAACGLIQACTSCIAFTDQNHFRRVYSPTRHSPGAGHRA